MLSWPSAGTNNPDPLETNGHTRERESQMDHQGSRTKKKELHNTKQPSSCPEASAEGPSRWHEKDEIKQKRYDDDDDDGGKSVNSSTSFELPGKKPWFRRRCAGRVCLVCVLHNYQAPDQTTNQPTYGEERQSVSAYSITPNLVQSDSALHEFTRAKFGGKTDTRWRWAEPMLSWMLDGELGFLFLLGMIAL